MADFIQTFRLLDARQRQRVLALLPAELTPYEWRQLHAITSARSFHTDIVGRLPIELAAHVFSYLDPAAPYRCQSVSRRWLHVLRSMDVIKATLTSWHHGVLPLQDADYASCVHAASRIQRLRTGRPVSVRKMVLTSAMACPHLFGHHLVWMANPWPQQSRIAHILNLNTWQLRSLAGEAREVLSSLVASDQIVLLTTATATCYVFQLHHDTPPKKFRLPSMRFMRHVACHGRTVACVALYDMCTSVFIWHYDTQQSTSFDITHGPDSILDGHSFRRIQHIAPVMRPETETIHLLFIVSDYVLKPLSQVSLVLATYTFRGEYISSYCPILPHAQANFVSTARSSFVPVDDSKTLFALRLQLLKSGLDRIFARSGTLDLQFNVKTHDLSISKGRGPRHHNPLIRFGDSLTWWKDTCYGFKLDTELSNGDMIAYMGTCDTITYLPIVSEKEREDEPYEDSNPQPLLVNENYVIRIVYGRVHLACFDDNSNRPTEESDFFHMGRLYAA